MSQSQALQTIQDNQAKILAQVITTGDLASLTPEQKVSHYNAVCHSLGLNPLTRPFEYITLDGKLTLYARKDATEQLRKNNGVSIWKVEQKLDGDCWIVAAYAKLPDGREDIDEGIVYIKGLLGQSAANARMKAVTKAKRRVTLSICGLGFLDESEIDSIPNAQPAASPEDDAVMTEAEALTLQHKAISLDQWKCGRGLAMQIIGICAKHRAKGMTDDVIKSWLPAGVTSRKDLDNSEAQYFIFNLERRLELFDICMALAEKGVDKDTMRLRLPGGAQSLKDLNQAQVEEALKAFTHWLSTYNQVVQGEVVNNG